MQIQEFFQWVGGGGVQVRRPENSLDVFCCCCFLSPQLILQWGSNGFIEKTILFQGSRGGPTFSRGPNFSRVGGGVQMLISIETHPGGSGPPIPTLDPHMRIYMM